MHKSELFSTANRRTQIYELEVVWLSRLAYLLVSVFFVKVTVKKSVNSVLSPRYYYLIIISLNVL